MYDTVLMAPPLIITYVSVLVISMSVGHYEDVAMIMMRVFKF